MTLTSELRQGLLEIYDQLAVEIAAAAPVCDLSGRCCRFKEYGHTLFISRPEAELLLEQGLPAGAVLDDAGCPFQVDRLCTARDRRPLGCRVYYCDPRYTGVGEELSAKSIHDLKDLHNRTNTPWEYRPLHHFLREREVQDLSIEKSGPEAANGVK